MIHAIFFVLLYIAIRIVEKMPTTLSIRFNLFVHPNFQEKIYRESICMNSKMKRKKNQTQFKSSHAEYEPKQKMEINKAYAVEKMYLC